MSKKNKIIYYSMFTDHSLGVYTSIEILSEDNFLEDETHTLGFSNFETASVYAITGYNTFKEAYGKLCNYNILCPPELNKLYTDFDIISKSVEVDNL